MSQYKTISTAIREKANVQDLELLKKSPHKWDYYDTFCEAVFRGNLDILEWVHNNSPKVHPWEKDTHSIQIAITAGNLPIVEFLVEHGYFSSHASVCVDNSSINGHLHVIKYLHANTSQLYFTEKSLTTSHLQVLEFFRELVNEKIKNTIKQD